MPEPKSGASTSSATSALAAAFGQGGRLVKALWVIALAVFVLAPPPALAAEPVIPASAATAEAFVPTGWTLDRRAQGDLNGDGVADLVLVVRDLDPANIVTKTGGLGPATFDANRRILIIAFGRGAGGFDLALRNSTFIPLRTDAVLADYLDENAIQIARGRLSITLTWFEEFGSWNRGAYSYVFRYRAGVFELTTYDSMVSARGSGNATGLSVSWITGIAVRAHGSVEAEQLQYRRVPGPQGPPPTLESIGDGTAYTPDLPRQ